MRDEQWIEQQRRFVTDREQSRAAQCQCGHDSGDHMEEVARCLCCKCGSYQRKREQEAA